MTDHEFAQRYPRARIMLAIVFALYRADHPHLEESGLSQDEWRQRAMWHFEQDAVFHAKVQKLVGLILDAVHEIVATESRK